LRDTCANGERSQQRKNNTSRCDCSGNDGIITYICVKIGISAAEKQWIL